MEVTWTNFGPYMRRLRGDRTLRDMAKLAKIEHSYLSRIEKGTSRPSESVVRQLAHAYNVNENELLLLAGYAAINGQADEYTEIKNRWAKLSPDDRAKAIELLDVVFAKTFNEGRDNNKKEN